MIRVDVKPEMLRWARERAGRSLESLEGSFAKLPEWEAGEAQPTFKQLEAFAKATRIPVGYLFLQEPLREHIPIPDFRTMRDHDVEQPSPDLLDTIYLCQQRQHWYRDFARKTGEARCEFLGSASLGDAVEEVAAEIRAELDVDLEERRRIRTWTDALRRLIEQADSAGVLVMVSGVVGSNTHRKLDPEEFRGFALCDDLAPVVFVNGADTKAAQMFTLAHELAHIWLGETALSNITMLTRPTRRVEKWCNRVAAEVLVPLAVFRREVPKLGNLREDLDRLARHFKVSTLVVLRRLHDAGLLTREEVWDAYEDELERLLSFPRSPGGQFYLTQAARAGKRFARAVIVSTFEGQSSFTEAFRLLGVRNVDTLRRFGDELEVPVG